MSILNQLNDIYKIATFNIASNNYEINQLKKYSKITLPQDFIEIIKEKTEIEINVKNKKYIRIWGAQNSLELNEAYMFKEYLPNSLAIGDDEGEYAFVYYDGAQGYGIYAIAFNDLDPDEMFYISPSLEALLVEGDGLTTILSL